MSETTGIGSCLKVLDLFSGIGGFSLGLERTGGFKTVAFCEIEEYPRKVLKKHWPNIPRYEDVRELTKEKLEADGIFPNVITGGFPCQDLSAAGKQVGITGDRSGLWGEMARLFDELRPKYGIMENVAQLLTGNNGEWFKRILGDLAAIGYDAEWHCIPAATVGAPHIRDRVWIVAYPDEVGRKIRELPFAFRQLSRDRLETASRNWYEAICANIRAHDGVSNRIHKYRIAALGNSVVPQIPELIGNAILEYEKNN